MKSFFVFIIILFTVIITSAQTKMFINKTNNTTDSIALNDIKSITFRIVTTPPKNGLVAWYPFNGNANDTSDKAHHGTVNGATLTTDRFNRVNSAYNFNGTSNFISIPHSSDFNYTGSDTISFSYWIKMNGVSTGGAIVCKSAIGGVSNYCTLWNGDSTHATISNHFGSGDVMSSSIKLLPNQWYHVVILFNEKKCSLFVNGVYNTTKTLVISPLTNSSPLYFGNDADGNQEFMKGVIDDLRIYRRSLSSEEVTALYNEN
ncbi:MAG: LamG domain-containing protein [Bacteroidota bacterium]|nr:LamG domain-containing protein [Bacteroidota bacterium]